MTHLSVPRVPPNRLLLMALGALIFALLTTTAVLVVSLQGALAPPPIVYQLPNQVSPSVVHAGDPIDITLRQCVQDGVDGQVYYTITRTLVEQSDTYPRRQLPTNSHTVPVGCSTTKATFARVPADLPPGVWHIESGIVAYGAHGAKLIYAYTEWFTVLPDDQPIP